MGGSRVHRVRRVTAALAWLGAAGLLLAVASPAADAGERPAADAPALPAPAGDPMPPDLVSIVPSEDMSITHPGAGVTEFDYEHIVYNASPGPLEVQPTGYDATTDLADGIQHIYQADGTGAPTYQGMTHQTADQFFFHDAHGHFHFPLASFGLYDVANDGSLGDPVAVSPKIGFCLGDSLQLDPRLEYSPDSIGYNGWTCSDPEALRGISSGWGDLYNREDPGQAIDITGVPDGVYWFHSVVDPEDNFVESDESNNVTDVMVRISGDTVTPVSPLRSQGSFLVDRSFLRSAVGAVSTPTFGTAYADDLLVAFVSAHGPYGGTQSATVSGAGLDWQRVARANTQQGTSEVWAARATGVLSGVQVTSQLSSPDHNQALAVFAVHGAGGVGAVATAQGSGGAPSASVTTTEPGSWVLGVGNDPDEWIPRMPRPGQVIVYDGVGEQRDTTHWVQARRSPTAASGTTVTLGVDYPSHDRWNLVAVELTPGLSDDTTPPAVSGVAVGDLLPDGATVTWRTDEPATSAVEFGTSSAYGTTTADSALVTDHARVLTGLVPDTTYHYRIRSTDAAGNERIGRDRTFTTAQPRTTPPAISNIQVSGLMTDQATIRWTTDVASTSVVQYGETTGYGVTADDPARVTSHFVVLGGLEPLTTYHFRVGGTDSYGNTGYSSDRTFTTPDVPPPVTVDRTVSSHGHGEVTATVSTGESDELLVAYVASDGPPDDPQRVSVAGGGLDWSPARRANGQAGTAEVWTARAPIPLDAVPVRSTQAVGAYDQSLTVVAYRDAEGVGVTAAASAPSGAAGASFSTSRAQSLVYGVGHDWDGAEPRTWAPGQEAVDQWVDDSPGDTFWVQRYTEPAGPVESVVSVGTTAPTEHRYNFVGAEIARPVSVPPPARIVTEAMASRNGTARTTTPAFDASRYDLLLAFVAADGPAARLQGSTVTGAGLTWRLVRRTNRQHGTAEVWRAYADRALTDVRVRSVLRRAGFGQSLTVLALKGAAGTGDVAGANARRGAASVTLTTAGPGSRVFAVGNDWDRAVARQMPADQRLLHQWVYADGGTTLWTQTRPRVVSTAGSTVSVGTVAPTSDRWNLSAVEVTAR